MSKRKCNDIEKTWVPVAVVFVMEVVSPGSALLPRQPVKAPAVERAAMVGFV